MKNTKKYVFKMSISPHNAARLANLIDENLVHEQESINECVKTCSKRIKTPPCNMPNKSLIHAAIQIAIASTTLTCIIVVMYHTLLSMIEIT